MLYLRNVRIQLGLVTPEDSFYEVFLKRVSDIFTAIATEQGVDIKRARDLPDSTPLKETSRALLRSLQQFIKKE